MLNIHWTENSERLDLSPLVVVVVEEAVWASQITPVYGAGVAELAGNSQFRGKPGESFLFTRPQGDRWQHVVFLGSQGKSSTVEQWVQLGHDAAVQASKVGASSLALDVSRVEGESASIQMNVARGFELGTYSYNAFMNPEKHPPKPLKDVYVLGKQSADAGQPGVSQGQQVASAIMRARDLVNGPAELVTPTYLAETASTMVAQLRGQHTVDIKILDREECQKFGMGCYLGVAQGGETPPKFIHMHYTPKAKSRGRVALIGKGVTFDSGGYSLKTSEGMMDMKMDMAGAAAVISAFEAIVKLELPWEVHVLVAATENMISGKAYRLGDVLRASNGRTVEINNTDAEGRLTLADALVYAGKLNPDITLDFATLTGACMIALGPHTAGVMSPHDALAEAFLQAAQSAGESMWRLPLPANLKDQLKSNVADMKNTGERYGGALTAGLFLSEFAEGQTWLHVDIAGPAMASKAHGVTKVGGTGFAVATIVEFLQRTQSAQGLGSTSSNKG